MSNDAELRFEFKLSSKCSPENKGKKLFTARAEYVPEVERERSCSTLRKDLYKLGFRRGRILYGNVSTCDEWPTLPEGRFLTNNDETLDRVYYTGFGGRNAPPIIAHDSEAIYLYSEYDGATRMFKVLRLLHEYITEEIPSPGG